MNSPLPPRTKYMIYSATCALSDLVHMIWPIVSGKTVLSHVLNMVAPLKVMARGGRIAFGNVPLMQTFALFLGSWVERLVFDRSLLGHSERRFFRFSSGYFHAIFEPRNYIDHCTGLLDRSFPES